MYWWKWRDEMLDRVQKIQHHVVPNDQLTLQIQTRAHTQAHSQSVVGGVAQWLGRQSLTGELSLIYT